MATQNEQQNSANAQMIIQTDIPLWNYLLGGHKKLSRKLSRVEAFFDLMKRQYAALHEGREEFLKGNVSELACAWHWSRDTAASFLDKLEQLDVITSQANGNSKLFRLNFYINKENVHGVSLSLSEPRKPSRPYNST
ncbi:MAG: hypothetical protein J5932_11200 [Prevotella sp.]|nr:hypothetical protein [Prevotella sp.]MBP3775949.1 hypothetical protein [Prevotella sp.]